MPSTTLVCPHCEKTVEIQVSSVTRSRPCPECGQMVMLQMAEKTTKTKRRALLMQQNDPAEVATTSQTRMTEPAYEPQPLPGDAFDRMRMDPEIQRFRRRLMLGAGAVGFIVLGIVVWSLILSAAKPLKPSGSKLAHKDETPDLQQETSILQRDDPLPQVNSGNLVFRPPGSNDLKTASPLPAGSNSSENLAKLAAAEEVLTKFLQTPSWKQRVLLVRDKLRVAPLMSIYYAKNADGQIEFDSIVEATEISPKFSEHVVVFEGGGRRMATVEHTPKGPLVDWESFVGAGEMAWSDFLELKQAAPTLFRVLVSPAGHYENSFGDPAVLSCYSLRNISEPGAKVVYGYAHKGSELAKELDYRLQQSADATVPMVLQLKFPPDAPVDFQVWIHNFVQAGWVTP
ncbi:MAG: hypothetical protein B7Z37_18440 [Verrucomicrobia bacterium 12-59-8]|nr:MAG: hypothetical protein B7Z37_18440 [Verrucomicrobia bacterium 12-59-8]